MPDREHPPHSDRSAARRRTYISLVLILVVVGLVVGLVLRRPTASPHYFSDDRLHRRRCLPRCQPRLGGVRHLRRRRRFKRCTSSPPANGGVTWRRSTSSTVYDPWPSPSPTPRTAGWWAPTRLTRRHPRHDQRRRHLEAAELGHDRLLYGVAFVNAKHGWVVGRDGTNDGGIILATTNGGATWKKQYADHGCGSPRRRLRQRHARLGGGRPRIILATTNGGATWKVQYSGSRPGGSLDAVACANTNEVWAVGQQARQRHHPRHHQRRRHLEASVLDSDCGWLSTSPSSARHGWAVGDPAFSRRPPTAAPPGRCNAVTGAAWACAASPSRAPLTAGRWATSTSSTAPTTSSQAALSSPPQTAAPPGGTR